jgi:hypothetical protein
MKSGEIADFLGVDSGAVEFILSNKDDFYAYVGKNLRFDIVKPRSLSSDLFLWNEWVNIFEIPIILDSGIYWVCSAEKPIAPKDWVDFLIKNIIYLNKIYTQCFLFEGRHNRIKILGDSAIFYVSDLDILRLISEICFPNNLGISFKWYELSRRAIFSLRNLSEAEKLYQLIPYDLIPAFSRKLEEFIEKDQLPSFLKDGILINEKFGEERIKYQEDYVDSIIESLLTLNSSIDVERKFSHIHPFLRVKVVRRWVEEKVASLKSLFEARRLYLNCFRRGDEELVLGKWKELSREAILFLGDEIEARKLYIDCHPELKPAIIVFLSKI